MGHSETGLLVPQNPFSRQKSALIMVFRDFSIEIGKSVFPSLEMLLL